MTEILNELLNAGGTWLFIILAPLLIASFAVFPSTRKMAIYLTPFAAAPALLLSLTAPVGVSVDLPALLLGTRLGLGEGMQVFLLLTAVIWTLAGLYAVGAMRSSEHRLRFHILFLITMSGNLGVVIAQDMATFYTTFAVMTFASYGLVIHANTSYATRAGRVYLSMAIVGEVLLFASMVVFAQLTGTIYFDEMRFDQIPATPLLIGSALAVLGLGVKSGLLGLHMWMPLAYSAAPTPASAVLSGAMVNAGLIGWLRLLPFGQVEWPVFGAIVAAVGLAGAFIGVAFGIMQRHPKSVLAYSSVSQMGLVTVMIGLGLMSPNALPIVFSAIILYALHHALVKASLFLVEENSRTSSGVLHRYLMGAAIVLLSLSLAGAPFTSGMVAKVAMKSASISGAGDWYGTLAVLLPVSSLGTALLMFRFAVLAWPAPTHSISVSRTVKLATVFLVGLASTLIWIWPAGTSQSVANDIVNGKSIWASIWPVLAGAIIGLVTLIVTRRHRPRRRLPYIPPGDLLSWTSAQIRKVRRNSSQLLRDWLESCGRPSSEVSDISRRVEKRPHRVFDI